MDLIQRIKEQGNQASVMLPGVADMAASSEVVTVDITGCTNYDDEGGVYNISVDDKKEQIREWVKSKAKFLRLTFKYGSNYGSVLFTKDAITDTESSDYTNSRWFSVESFISRVSGTCFFFDLLVWHSAGISFFVRKLSAN